MTHPPSIGIASTEASAGQVATSVTITGLTMSDPIPTVKLARSRTTDACSVAQPSGSSSMHGSSVAVGTACAISCIVRPVPQSAFPTSPREGMNSATPINRVSNVRRNAATISNTRRTLHRWIPMGLRGGASPRNVSSSPRPSAFIDDRSCDGLATPRVAANASDSSSGVK